MVGSLIIVSMFSDWNPMKDDFSSPSFNSYTKGPGASLKPVGGSSTNSFTLFIDKIPISLTRVRYNVHVDRSQ